MNMSTKVKLDDPDYNRLIHHIGCVGHYARIIADAEPNNEERRLTLVVLDRFIVDMLTGLMPKDTEKATV